MSRSGYGLMKAHFGIMKMTAIADFNCVRSFCEKEGKSHEALNLKWGHKKIEDATARMLKQFSSGDIPLKLHRGISFYYSI